MVTANHTFLVAEESLWSKTSWLSLEGVFTNKLLLLALNNQKWLSVCFNEGQ